MNATRQNLSYAAFLQRVAKRHDFEVVFDPPATVTGQILLEDAAALRALAAELEQIERRWREHGPNKWHVGTYDTSAAFCNRIAAGFSPSTEVSAP